MPVLVSPRSGFYLHNQMNLVGWSGFRFYLHKLCGCSGFGFYLITETFGWPGFGFYLHKLSELV